MKIRAVKLTHFRKFAGVFGVEGIADGVNVLIGRNELGKSTLLDAINGVIFEKARSNTETVRSFRHAVNGAVPEVELTFELDGVQWTIRKRFSGPTGKAWLTSSHQRRFEDEAAEAELQRLLGFEGRRGGGGPGIWGTLWVSQGQAWGEPVLDAAGRNALQACIESQVGVVTGGERGRKIPLAVERALEAIQSSRGPRGPFKEAKEQLADVNARVAQLEAKRDEIFTHMDALARRKRERQRVQADWSEEDHRRDLEAARDRRTAAATRAARIEAARSDANLAAERAAQAQRALDDRAGLARELASIDEAIGALTRELDPARQARDELQRQCDAGEARLNELRGQARRNGEQGRRLARIREAVALRDEIARHEATLKQGAELRAEVEGLAERIGEIMATDDAVARIETAATTLAGAAAAVRAVATTLELAIEPAALGRIRLNGAPLEQPETSLDLVTPADLAIEGVGRITISPRIQEHDVLLERRRRAELELADALAAAGVGDLAAARQAAARRGELERKRVEAQRALAGLAPPDPERSLAAGLDARQARIRELQGRIKTERAAFHLSDLPPVEALEREIADNRAEAERLNTALVAAEAAVTGPKAALARAEASWRELEQRLGGQRTLRDTRQAELAAARDQSGDGALATRADALRRDAEEQRATLAHLESTAGEAVDAIDLRIQRLEAAAKNHHRTRGELDQEIARLTALIDAHEGAGVEEALAAAGAEQARLEAAVQAYEEEVHVLRLLQQTLREAEQEAKARYLAPVVSRVEPYLRTLWPGASVTFDENLNLGAIERDGAEEPFARLSGGTREQLAILTRLAFAELLLNEGRPAAVILDDALAFSDDERIEQMFDILQRAGARVQVLVLTCRRRLFSRLGATELNLIEHEDPA